MSNKNLLIFHKYTFFFFSLMILIGCSRNDAPIAIHLFKYNNSAVLGPTEKNEVDGWEPLLNVDLSKSDLVINESNIINYDWAVQKIYLDSELKEPFGYDKLLPNFAYFVLALGDTLVVGGIVLPWSSAVGSRVPVLYISHPLGHPDNPGMEMGLGIDANSSYPTDNQDLMKNVRNRLQKIGKLIE